MLEFLTIGGMFAFGTVAFYGFWFALFIGLCVLSALAEHEFWGWSTIVAIVALIGLKTSGVFDVISFTVNHPWVLVQDILKYLAGSIIWASFKWWRLCSKSRDRYNEARAKFLAERNATEFTDELRLVWSKRLIERRGYGDKTVEIPSANSNKEKILSWMYLWPFSVLATIFSDWVRELFMEIYKRMGKLYDAIALAAWKGVEKDIVPVPPALATETEFQRKKRGY
jgi:hypothetical protein